MSESELLIKEVQSLPPGCVKEVLDFIGYLRQKYAQIPEDIPNAVTRAAIEEGRAMMRNEIPANRFNTLEEMLQALHN